MLVDVARGSLRVSASGALEVLGEGPEHLEFRASGAGSVALRFSGCAGEKLVGLGERFVRLEQTGRRWAAEVVDLLAAEPEDTYHYVPLLFSSAGYAVLLESHARAVWDLAGGDAGWSVAVPEPQVRLHVLRGAPMRLVELATAITGRPPVPPAWALGVWKTTLSGTEAVLREAERLRAERIPTTACWVYDHYDEDTNSGCGIPGTYPHGEYPSLPALTGGLHDLGYRALGYVQPCIFTGSSAFEEARARGHLVRRADGSPATIPFFNPKLAEIQMVDDAGAYVDLTDPDAAAWYAGLLRATLGQGWDGWMQDMGEHLPHDAVLADGTTGAETHNRYPLLYHRTAHEVWSQQPGAAVFARSGTLGSVPYVTAMWPGDQHCDWSPDRGLPSVLPAGPSIGLTGVAVWGPDIVGIVDGRDGGAGGRDEELWIRGCQYGALNPVMRDHLGFKALAGTPVDLWSTERTRRVFRAYAELHLRLVPYLAALARHAHDTGVPIVRALLLHFPGHDEAWSIADEYLLGPYLLVAPVHVKGATSRRVWFPPGEWVCWWEGRRYTGPAWHDVPAPLERVPLFQLAGSALPLLTAAPEDLATVAADESGGAVEQRRA